MEADFTLVPIGGLGNRLYAICSAVAYCKDHRKTLKIIWFRDHNLNCPVSELFSLCPDSGQVELRDAGWSDLVLRDNPRRRNLWIPRYFQRFLFDRRIYESEVYMAMLAKDKKENLFGDLTPFRHVFMVSYWYFYTTESMWRPIVVHPQIADIVCATMKKMDGKRTVGVHIRRTDHIYAIKESPTELFIRKMEDEIARYGEAVCFYLASDSQEVKEEIGSRFGSKVVMMERPACRNSREGIIDGFAELQILSRTDKIYASSKSSFSELAHFFSGNDFEVVTNENIV